MPIGELFGWLRRRSVRTERANRSAARPAPLDDQPLSFAEIVAAASFLDFGGVPADLVIRDLMLRHQERSWDADRAPESKPEHTRSDSALRRPRA